MVYMELALQEVHLNGFREELNKFRVSQWLLGVRAVWSLHVQEQSSAWRFAGKNSGEVSYCLPYFWAAYEGVWGFFLTDIWLEQIWASQWVTCSFCGVCKKLLLLTQSCKASCGIWGSSLKGDPHSPYVGHLWVVAWSIIPKHPLASHKSCAAVCFPGLPHLPAAPVWLSTQRPVEEFPLLFKRQKGADIQAVAL